VTTPSTVHRFEVRPAPGRLDARGTRLRDDAPTLGLSPAEVSAARVYLVEAALSPEQVQRIGDALLADRVTERCTQGSTPADSAAAVVEVHPLPGVMDPAGLSVREAIADLLQIPLHAGLDDDASPIHVSTGWRFDVRGLSPADARTLVRGLVANPVIHRIHDGSWTPDALPRGHAADFQVRSISLLTLTDEQLQRLSRDAHLFLSLDEMRAVQTEFRTLGRDPTDIELETIAQTWSEHCVHKTLKSKVRYRTHSDSPSQSEVAGAPPAPSSPTPKSSRTDFDFAFTPTGKSSTPASKPKDDNYDWDDEDDTDPNAPITPEDPIDWSGRPGHTTSADGTITIDNLLKSTVAAATHELIADGLDWAISVFKDNSGIIAFDDNFGACIKVETHNRPSAIEPYGGSATGVGGCIRDVIGTGLGARPIANTDVFCVAPPDQFASASSLPPGVLPPRRILSDVVAGVRDYGNRMGIPTVSGGVFFDARHIGNPLVFCGCIGLIPRDKCFGAAKPGDIIVALGGRTGRDGVHGATFSSAELESTASTEFAHAVQIGNAIEEKRLLDAILRARDGGDSSTSPLRHSATPPLPLYNAITDCGAGGFSSAVGEMGAAIGAQVDLDRAPLKYAGLSYTEIWISEAQERMILAVPAANLAALRSICDEEGVEMAELGTFGTPNAELILRYRQKEVGRLPMHFLHEGIPTPTREATWTPAPVDPARRASTSSLRLSVSPSLPPSTPSLRLSVSSSLLSLLSHPTIASKHWIISQYDHEVQGNTVLKPLVGPAGRGPGDASVLEPVPGTNRGLAISCGLQTGVGDPALPAGGGDPYQMALAGIDECVRNLVCVGADPRRIAILDNFCWPSCDKPENLGMLVRAAEGCYDGAKAYKTPFVSGKDSLNNQFRYTDPATGESRTIEIPPTLLITGLAIVPSVKRVTSMDAKKPGNLLVVIGATTDEIGGSLLQKLLDSGSGYPHSPNGDSVYPHSPSGASSIAPASLADWTSHNHTVPRVDLSLGPRTAHAVANLITDGIIVSAHDCSEGGLLVSIAEMLIAAVPADVSSGVASPQPAAGAEVAAGSGGPAGESALASLLSGAVKPGSGAVSSNPLADIVKKIVSGAVSASSSAIAASSRAPAGLGLRMTLQPGSLNALELAFAETPSRYIVELAPADLPRLKTILRDQGGIHFAQLGTLDTSGRLVWEAGDVDIPVPELMDAWRSPLDW
jgi:phosphoribosylformylglycinamidine synthase II